MILPDVNLLIYAYNAADSRHDKARLWWESAIDGRVPVGLTWVFPSLGLSG